MSSAENNDGSISKLLRRASAGFSNKAYDPDEVIGKRMRDLFENYGTPFPPVCGYLLKRGKWRKEYKKRWFVYNERLLSLIYAASPKPNEKAKGVVKLSSDCFVEGEEDYFKIVTPHRTFYLKGAKTRETQSWEATIADILKDILAAEEAEKERKRVEQEKILEERRKEQLALAQKMKEQGHEMSGLGRLLTFSKKGSFHSIQDDIESENKKIQEKRSSMSSINGGSHHGSRDSISSAVDSDMDESVYEESILEESTIENSTLIPLDDEPKKRRSILFDTSDPDVLSSTRKSSALNVDTLQLPGASAPKATGDRKKFRGKSMSLKPMQALRLDRSRRLSGAVGGSLYSHEDAAVAKERLLALNEYWKNHVGVKDKEDEEDKEEEKPRVGFGHAVVIEEAGAAKPGAAEEDGEDEDDSSSDDASEQEQEQEETKEDEPAPEQGEREEADHGDDDDEIIPEPSTEAPKEDQISLGWAAPSEEAPASPASPTKTKKKKKLVKKRSSVSSVSGSRPSTASTKKKTSTTSLKSPKAAAGVKKVVKKKRPSTGTTTTTTGVVKKSGSDEKMAKSPTVKTKKVKSTPKTTVKKSASSSTVAKKTVKSTPKSATRKTKVGKASPGKVRPKKRKSSAASLSDMKKSPSLKDQIQANLAKEAKSKKGSDRAKAHHARTSTQFALGKSDSIEVKDTQDMGLGVFATKDIEAGEVVFVEKKLLGVQNFDNRLLVCSQCLTCIGPVEKQLQLLANGKQVDKLPYLPESAKTFEEVVPCKKGCGDIYCSHECRIMAWMQYHQLLCSTDTLAGKHLKRFYEHAKAAENERFVLAAKVMANIILTMRRKQCELDEAMHVYKNIQKDLWWETVRPPDDLDMEEAQIFTQLLVNMCQTSLALLKKALLRDSVHRPMFNLKFFGGLLGMFEQNNWPMKSKNPLTEYWEHVRNLPQAKVDKVKKALGPAYKFLEPASRVNGEGTGIFELGVRINHSCMPNVMLSKPQGVCDDLTAVVAKRPIVSGEQVFISYIDEKQPFEARREAMSYYGFECKCVKCLKDELNFKMSKPKIEFFYSSVSGNRQVKKETTALQNLLDAHKVDYEMVDLSLDENMHRKANMLEKSGKSTLPQIFVDGKYRGALSEIHAANEMAGGFHRFLYCGPLRRLSFYNPKFFAVYHQDDED